jgi:asparagine N-glycosylation enzyme membrane subunit Stt3
VGSVVFGVLSIWGFYLLLLSIGVSRKVSLTTAFLISITPWHIQYSRAGFEITLLSCLLIFGL